MVLGFRMWNPGQARVAVVICLILIVVLLMLHLKKEYIGIFLGNHDMLLDKKAVVSMVRTEQENTIDKEISTTVVSVLIVEEEAYNKEMTNLRRIGLTANIKDVNLTQLSLEELLLTIHSYPDNTDVVCQRKLRMGRIGDGGWEVCDDPDVRPRPPCIVYSFGINYDFSFDDDSAKVYGCEVYSFDPSMVKFEAKVQRSELVQFYKIGLSDREYTNSNRWKLNTLGGIRAMLGHQNKTIDVLKIDIEGSEWQAVPEMVQSGQLQAVRQLMLEYHVSEDTKGYLLPKLQAIQALEKEGFKRFYTHKNPACRRNIRGYPIIRTSCYEVYYIRR